MNHEPWVNHDIHRIGKLVPKSKPVFEPRPAKPYPTQERVRELFILENGKLFRKQRHHRERPDLEAGTRNPKCGKMYVRVDDKQCRVEKLIEIYNGEG